MSAHTPGPWLAERHGIVSAVVGERRRQVALTTGDAVMHGDPSIPVIELQMANARLIAAAPEMLEALRGVLDDLERRYDGAPDSSTKWMIRPIEAIEAAIAKAEGKR